MLTGAGWHKLAGWKQAGLIIQMPAWDPEGMNLTHYCSTDSLCLSKHCLPAWSLEDYQRRRSSPGREMSGINALCADVFQCYTTKGEAIHYTLLQLWAPALLPTTLKIKHRVIKSPLCLWRYAQDPSWKYARKSVSHQHENHSSCGKSPDFRALKLNSSLSLGFAPHSSQWRSGSLCIVCRKQKCYVRKQEQDSTPWAFKALPLEAQNNSLHPTFLKGSS